MIRRLAFLIAGIFATLMVAAVEPSDSLRVQVGVEISMPDGTRVIRQVNTMIPDPGPDASVATLVNLAAAKLSPDYRPVEVREVKVIETKVVEVPVAPESVVPEQVAQVVEGVAAVQIEECAEDVDSLTGQPIVPLLPADSVEIKPAKPVRRHYDRHAWDPIAPDAVRNVRFAWGADVGSSVDLSGNDMTSVDINMCFGMTYRWLIFAGVGVGAQMSFNNSCRTYPVYLNLRTDFSRKVLPIFLDMRVGSAFNYLPGNINQQALFASLSLGFNMATGRTFRSYIMCGYTYNGRGDVDSEIGLMRFPALSLASVRLGVQF